MDLLVWKELPEPLDTISGTVPRVPVLLIWKELPEPLVTISGTIPHVPVLLGSKELPEPLINSLWKNHLAPTGTVRGKEPRSAESIAAFKNQSPGRLWYGEGRLPDARVFLIQPLFPGALRVGEILCLRRLRAKALPERVSRSWHRSSTTRCPGGRSRNTRTSGRRPSPYHDLPGGVT